MYYQTAYNYMKCLNLIFNFSTSSVDLSGFFTVYLDIGQLTEITKWVEQLSFKSQVLDSQDQLVLQYK